MLEEYLDRYLDDIASALKKLDRRAVWAVIEELMTAWREHRQVFLLGNGGSAALASHMANDLCKTSIVNGQPRLRAIALTENVPLLTAWANDNGFEHIFSEQLYNLCQPNDLVIAISCSGNSTNVLRALRAARELRARTIGFTGDTGGQLKDLVDLCVFAPAEKIWPQEDVHVILDHVIASTLHLWITAIAEQSAHPMRGMILAAGAGTRLRPLTLDKPKPMLPINGQPLLHYTIEWLREAGIHEVAINVHHRPDAIIDHFGDGSRWGVKVHYSHEDQLWGTAGAVRRLNGFIDNDALVVVYGDVLTNMDLRGLMAFHRQQLARDPSLGVTLSLQHLPNPIGKGLVELDDMGRVTRFVEKPAAHDMFGDLVNAGVMIVEPSVIDRIPRDTFYDFGQHLLPELLHSDRSIYGWIVPPQTYLIDIGTPENYAQAQRDWPVSAIDRA
ncbi:MAG TPA: sugar phosphate nucleotidyltransferase [Anaerolineae bacterium]|nr:sugar phosphate nucleotidyltransferase [Anaerolineae bacterium]